MVNYKSASGKLENSWWLQDNTINGAMSITTNFVINQVIWYFLTNCFTFLTKGWMPQVRKSCSCGISAIFFQCFFMVETQVLMTVSDFSGFFLGIIYWKGDSLFNGGVVFRMGWASFLSGGAMGGGIGFIPRHPPLPLWETLKGVYFQ